MRHLLTTLTIAGILTVATACSARGPEANRSRFQRNVGISSSAETLDKAMRVIRQYAFVVEQEEPMPNLVIQTRWRDRAPLADEQTLGIRTAQNRVILRARPRGAGSTGQQTFTIDVVIENRVQLVGSNAWTEASATKEYEKWANRIIEDFQREYNVGVRR